MEPTIKRLERQLTEWKAIAASYREALETINDIRWRGDHEPECSGLLNELTDVLEGVLGANGGSTPEENER